MGFNTFSDLFYRAIVENYEIFTFYLEPIQE